MLRKIVDKLADWVIGLFIGQAFLVGFELAKRNSALLDIFAINNIENAYSTAARVIDVLWWIDFILLATGIFWGWYRKRLRF
jgi:hypothetical protein